VQSNGKFSVVGEFPWLLVVDGERDERYWRAIYLCARHWPLIHAPWPVIMRPQNPNIHRYKWPKQTLPRICEKTMVKAKIEHTNS